MTDISPNGCGLARVTGWQIVRLVLSPSRGKERVYRKASLVAVCRPNAAHRGILYGPPDAAGRRQIVAQETTLAAAIMAGNRIAGAA